MAILWANIRLVLIVPADLLSFGCNGLLDVVRVYKPHHAIISTAAVYWVLDSA